jgi:hypothetical protein
MSIRTFAKLAILVAATLSASTIQAQPGRSTQSRIERKTYDFKEAGKEMEYALFVPTTYDKAKKTPLVIALHGLGSTPQQILRYRGLTDQAEKYGCIVAAPMGYNTSGWYGARVLRKKSTDPENLSELSEKDVLNVLEIVRKDYSVASISWATRWAGAAPGTWRSSTRTSGRGLARSPRPCSARRRNWKRSGISRSFWCRGIVTTWFRPPGPAGGRNR